MTLSFPIWAHFLLPGHSCLSLALFSLRYPALHLPSLWLVCHCPSHFLVFFSSPLIDNSNHSHLQSC